AAREDDPPRLAHAARDLFRRADGRAFGSPAREAAAAHAGACGRRRGAGRGASRVTDARERAGAAGLPFAPVPPVLPDRALLASLPMQYARRHLVLPLGPATGPLDVAVADPFALAPLDDLLFLYQ